MLTPSLEDYLEEIYNFSKMESKIRVIDIGTKLGVSSPSVVKALKKLEDEGYIIYVKYKGIHLTQLGRREGDRLVKRNAILQRFLTLINPSCNSVTEAEACEHYLSPSTIEAFQKLWEYFNENKETLDDFLRRY